MQTDWDEMTEEQREEANEAAWAMASDRVRQVRARNPELTLEAARKAAYSELQSDIDEEARLIREAGKSRATQMAKRFAANSQQRINDYSLAQGFVFDVDGE